MIINSNYYKSISSNLVSSAKEKLIKRNFKTYILDVPGVHEIPFSLKKKYKKIWWFRCFRLCSKGQTPHFDLICSSTFNAIMNISIKYNKPIGNGIITALNLKQAKQRSKKIKTKNKTKGQKQQMQSYLFLEMNPKNLKIFHRGLK